MYPPRTTYQHKHGVRSMPLTKMLHQSMIVFVTTKLTPPNNTLYDASMDTVQSQLPSPPNYPTLIITKTNTATTTEASAPSGSSDSSYTQRPLLLSQFIQQKFTTTDTPKPHTRSQSLNTSDYTTQLTQLSS
jgi:hypothetical protein